MERPTRTSACTRRGKTHVYVEPQTQVTFLGVDHSPSLDALIRSEIAKLYRFHARIVRCRVVVGTAWEQHKGAPYRIAVELRVPGKEIVVDHPTQDLTFAVREAFRKARRRLYDYTHHDTQYVKTHGLRPSERARRA